MSNRKPALGFIFVTLALDIIGIGLIIPILPKLIKTFHPGDGAWAAMIYGSLVSLYALMQFVCAPILGSLSDRFGRRKVILCSLFGSGLDYIFLAFSQNLTWFFIGRIIAGITGANLSACMAYIADITPPEKRAQSYGMVGAAFGMGFVIGPLLGGYLGEISLRLPFEVAAALTLLNWLYGMFVLPESLAPQNRRAFSWGRANPIGSLLALKKHPVVLSLTGTLFLWYIAHDCLRSVWVLYTDHRYNWTSKQVGASLAVVGIMAAVVQGGLVRFAVPRFGEARCVIGGFFIAAAAQLGYGLASQGWMIYVILVIGSLGAVAGPALQGIITSNVGADEQGAVQGALGSLQSIAGVIAPAIATNLFGYFTSPKAPVQLPGISFYFASALVLLAAVLAIGALKKYQRPALK